MKARTSTTLARLRAISSALLLLAACHSEAPADQITASPASPVVDEADIIPQDAEAGLDRQLRDYRDEEGTAIVVNTIQQLDNRSIESYAFDTFNGWGIGSARDNRGVLVVVAVNDREARIEVGCGLETVLTDEVARQIMDENMIPYFRAGDFTTGIDGAVDGIAAALAESEVEPGPASAICLERAA